MTSTASDGGQLARYALPATIVVVAGLFAVFLIVFNFTDFF
ncbi:hypothetical protein [Rhodoplanes roseus]|nr:hypothetical protein [Rhodoplanes roseus]